MVVPGQARSISVAGDDLYQVALWLVSGWPWRAWQQDLELPVRDRAALEVWRVGDPRRS